MLIVQNLILILCVLIWSLICGYIGFYYAKSKTPVKNHQPPSEAKEEDVRKYKKSVMEYQNFLSYDGTEQKDFND